MNLARRPPKTNKAEAFKINQHQANETLEALGQMSIMPSTLDTIDRLMCKVSLKILSFVQADGGQKRPQEFILIFAI
jgi:hypothetical protein